MKSYQIHVFLVLLGPDAQVQECEGHTSTRLIFTQFMWKWV